MGAAQWFKQSCVQWRFIGGGQLGYNFQSTLSSLNFVAGLEADMQGVAQSGSNHSLISIYPGPLTANSNRAFAWSETVSNSTNSRANLEYLGTVRGRLGFLVTPSLLVYGTGGLAYGGISLDVTQIQTSNFTRTNLVGQNAGVSISGGRLAIGAANYSNTQVGYTAGGGVEWMFAPNWSTKVEYLYYDLGNISVSSFSISKPFGNLVEKDKVWTGSTISSRITGNIVRAGVNYHFNFGGPVAAVAKY